MNAARKGKSAMPMIYQSDLSNTHIHNTIPSPFQGSRIHHSMLDDTVLRVTKKCWRSQSARVPV